MNLAAAYMQEGHMDEAVACCEEAYSISTKNSLLYFRWSQAYSYDQLAPLEKLEEARALIRKAAEVYAGEKIYREQNQRILRMLNIHNTAEAIEFQRNHVETQIKMKEDEMKNTAKGKFDITVEFLELARDYCEIEDEMIAEGKVPASRLEFGPTYVPPPLDEEDARPYILTQKMLKKTRDLMTFNVEIANAGQLKASRIEFEKVQKIMANILFIRDLPISSSIPQIKEAADEVGVNPDLPRIHSKVWKIKIDRVNQIYGQADFNYQLFCAMLEEHFADERKKKEREDKKQKREADDLDLKPADRSRSNLIACFRFILYFVIIGIVVTLFLNHIWSRNGRTLGDLGAIVNNIAGPSRSNPK